MDTESQRRILNHVRIEQLLRRGENHLHKIFRERWEIYCKLNNKVNKWNDDEASGKELIVLCASAAPAMKDLLKSGNIEIWDITLTNLAIQSVSKEIRKFGGQTDKNEDKMINALREVRNVFKHGQSELSDDEFVKFWDELQDILINLGDDVIEINMLKEKLKELGQTKIIEINSPEPKSKFIKLKEEGNRLFKDEKYNEAIKIYDKILTLSQLLPENQATIFSNRSVAYLKLNDEKYLKMAKRDAEWAIQLWPCWWRGYYRLGQAEAKLGEFEEAMKSLEKAMALNPESKEVFDELSAVRRQHGIISREEHFNPSSQTKSHDIVMKEISERLGISNDKIKNLFKEFPMEGQYGDIFKAHQFRDGEGVPQDYTKAASYYAKAAAAGNPEGMYNLAQLYETGKGVKRDFDESLRWLLKAANGKALIMYGSGVAEAQHTLGLKYTEGVGVEQNFKTAAEWYEKAVKNGFPASANNLGILYKRGQGVERDLKKAFQYFKISAQGGDTAGMGNLAHCYFTATGTDSIVPTKEMNAEGMKWLRIAAEKGDLVAARQLEKREQLNEDEAMMGSLINFFFTSGGSGGPKANPLDEKQFGKDVENAAKNGSIIAKRQLEIWKNLHIAMEAFKQNNPEKLICSLSKAIRLDHQIMHPQNLRFIYFHAIALCMQEKPTEECLKALDEFLALAPKDHDKVPACHYRKASYYFVAKQHDKFLASVKDGLEAEKFQLPCFLPYQFPSKDMMMKIYSLGKIPGDKKNVNVEKEEIKAGPSAIRQINNIINDPMRKLMITKNREYFVNIINLSKNKNCILTNNVPNPPKSPAPPRLAALKPIMLKDIDTTKEKVYDGYVLEAKIIDWPVLIKSIATVIQDENGDVQ
uniref:Uncharacterized protein n=1 Tax=Panagrolaimus sp. ES5 TaxID=591445 RepID=A0AC34F8H9_9BILA